MDFLKHVGKEALFEDSLVVFARDCGYRESFTRFLKYYCDICVKDKRIVLVLNCDNYIDILQDMLSGIIKDKTHMPVVINSSIGTVSNRQSLYATGGVFFITSRILQLDFLQKKIPFDSISGVLVYNSEQLHPGSTELFCLLLFRHNCNGFVKCFSNSASGCLTAFPQLSSFLSALTVKTLLLYPRGRDVVRDAYRKYPLHIDEVTITPPEWVQLMQKDFEDCIKNLITELTTLSCDLNPQLTVDYCLQSAFPAIVRENIEQYKDKYQNKTKQLLQELLFYNNLYKTLCYDDVSRIYDAIDKAYCKAVVMSTTSNSSCYWMEMKEMEDAIRIINSRVFMPVAQPTVPIDEEWTDCPMRWSEMQKSLDEVNQSNKEECKTNVLISVLSLQSIRDIYNFLLIPDLYIVHSLQRSMTQHMNNTTTQSRTSNESKMLTFIRNWMKLKLKKDENHTMQYLDQLKSLQDVTDLLEKQHGVVKVENHMYSKLNIFLAPYYKSSQCRNPFTTCNPEYMIVLDANPVAIRQAEMYNSLTKGRVIKRMVFIISEGVEQKNYEFEMKKETTAFMKLADERTRLITTEEWKVKPQGIQIEATSTRNASKKTNEPSTIIVDSREFNASLPSALYKNGFVLMPVTLTICDYVLSDTIGVERKSFADLCASLSSGRLQKQMEHMCRTYSIPILLIEEAKELHLCEKNNISIILTRLVVLVRLYPRMRILWSFSDLQTCRMFEMIKSQQHNPSLGKVMVPVTYSYLNGNKQDVERIDLLLKFPGITLDNVYSIERRITKVNDICEWSIQDFERVMPTKDAEALFAFLHTPLSS